MSVVVDVIHQIFERGSPVGVYSFELDSREMAGC